MPGGAFATRINKALSRQIKLAVCCQIPKAFSPTGIGWIHPNKSCLFPHTSKQKYSYP